MSSLTPAHRSEEATSAAKWEGTINGLMTLVPTAGALFLAMKNPKFVARTNWQSRTALLIMPAMFVSALTSEQKLSEKMHEIASENTHNTSTVQWAERQHAAKSKDRTLSQMETEEQLSKLYHQSVKESGVNIVPGDTLSLHHRMANYVAENPLKVLAGMAVPSIGWIFYGRTGKEHLDFSVKLLHTRVFGQFATISLLLSVMGFKEFMDQNGKYITEAEADARVEEMRQVRASLLMRLQAEKEHREWEQEQIAKAHEQDVKEHNVHYKKNHHKKKNHNQDSVQTIEEGA